MNIFLIGLLVTVSLAAICDEPQRTFYMSFPTLSKRDTIANLFDEMRSKMTKIDSNYTDSTLKANFKIIGMQPHPYYNDHTQKDTFVDKYVANVTMGVIAVSSFFNYTVDYEGVEKKGVMRVKGFLDSGYFTKSLKMTDGYLQWVPKEVPALSFTQDFQMEYSSPNVTDNERKIFLKMLNNQAGVKRIRDQIINEMNSFFVPLLVNHLNHQDLISSNNFTYIYRNISLQFMNFAKDFGLTNSATKGLEAFLIFGLESSTENCTVLPKEFDEGEYGGLQEMYTMGIVRSMLKEAISKGLYDVQLNGMWEVPQFQFYMGDLGNSVAYANYAPASDPFKVTCKCNTSAMEKEFKVMRYDQHMIYVTVPQTCTINYANTDIISMSMDINIVVKVVGQEDHLRVVVQHTGLYDLRITSLDKKYQVTSESLFKYSATQVLKGLEGKSTFGANFPTIRRKYPVARILDDKIVLFDPSEY